MDAQARLFRAAREGDPDALAHALAQGADPALPDRNDMLAIMHCVAAPVFTHGHRRCSYLLSVAGRASQIRHRDNLLAHARTPEARTALCRRRGSWRLRSRL